MKKITKVLAMVLVMVVVATAITTEAQAATKTITLSSKSYKKVSYIKKTGEYKLKFRCKKGIDSPALFVAFTAPSKGTYTIELSKLYLRGQSVEESLCTMGANCYSEYSFSGFSTRWHDPWFDVNTPVFAEISGQKASFSSAHYWDLCYDPETGRSEDGWGNVNTTLTVKYKLKKGESIYFELGGLEECQIGAGGCYADKTGYCTMTIKKK